MSTDDEGTRPVDDPAPAVPTSPDDAAVEADDHGDHAASGSPRRRVVRRILISVGVLGLALALLIGGSVWFLTERYAGNIDRVSNAFSGLDQKARPAESSSVHGDGTPVTFLL